MDYPVPVVRLIIPNAEGKVLLLRRSGAAYANQAWCLPGGKIDYEQTAEEAVRRELREETELTPTSIRFLFYQDSLPLRTGGMHCINLYFECGVSGNIALNDESSEYAWIGPSDLESYDVAFRNDEALARYWQTETQ
ncbi:MAG: hypothetical protein COY42_23735 [Armatimonadetes bacterium CG_4_10_14_0_8_um_filter_66_14]|nr:MAG: hypothetical protein AUJ96_04765 [Armatimonadetes bacterium CG2_30_66_41]PIX45177.1 MAG: hypothetical protein COZ57_16195 [Armatimonadetes bacterium CG_4_8_14_3_um_filter_66_20]PIZ37755.1 MAG: hypothetical protein COY42_23735 [Armatimonadetes bacterium CG_4_10_14_0_8_um_filter_66_14]